MFERLVAESLGGVVALDFAPEGLRWALSIPTNHIVANPLVAPNRSADQSSMTHPRRVLSETGASTIGDCRYYSLAAKHLNAR